MLEQCKTLYEYSVFVDRVRKNLESQNIDEAVENAVNYCIDNNILAEFLKKNRAEVISMAIFECSMEEVLEQVGKDKLEEGAFNFAAELYKDNTITLEIAIEKLGITEEEFLKKYKEYLKEQD